MAQYVREELPLRLRKIMWDIVPCGAVQTYMPVLDMTPASEEGAELEHKQAHQRMGSATPFFDHISVYSALAARVLTALALRLHVNEADPGLVAYATGQYAETIEYAATAIVAEMLADGILAPGPNAGQAIELPKEAIG